MTFPADGIFNGGQMTDLPLYPGTAFNGAELFELVSPGNAALGVNYAITTQTFLQLIISLNYMNTIITSGATTGAPYQVLTTDTRVLFDKSIGAASGAQLGLSSLQLQPVLIKDIKGDADTNPITITFSSAQTCDGLTTVVISTPYGGYWFNPLPAGWYLGTG